MNTYQPLNPIYPKSFTPMMTQDIPETSQMKKNMSDATSLVPYVLKEQESSRESFHPVAERKNISRGTPFKVR
jgi:hypothetical protein